MYELRQWLIELAMLLPMTRLLRHYESFWTVHLSVTAFGPSL
jgi:hypothetical protein